MKPLEYGVDKQISAAGWNEIVKAIQQTTTRSQAAPMAQLSKHEIALAGITFPDTSDWYPERPDPGQPMPNIYPVYVAALRWQPVTGKHPYQNPTTEIVTVDASDLGLLYAAVWSPRADVGYIAPGSNVTVVWREGRWWILPDIPLFLADELDEDLVLCESAKLKENAQGDKIPVFDDFGQVNNFAGALINEDGKLYAPKGTIVLVRWLEDRQHYTVFFLTNCEVGYPPPPSSSGSSTSSGSSASEGSEGGGGEGCGGVTTDIYVLTAVPTRSGDNLILPCKKLEFVDGCLKSIEYMPDYSVNVCCDSGGGGGGTEPDCVRVSGSITPSTAMGIYRKMAEKYNGHTQWEHIGGLEHIRWVQREYECPSYVIGRWIDDQLSYGWAKCEEHLLGTYPIALGSAQGIACVCAAECPGSSSSSSTSSDGSSSNGTSNGSSSSNGEQDQACSFCQDGTTPSKMEVMISGVQNGTCEACDTYNGTFQLTQDQQNSCKYAYFFDPPPCGDLEDLDQISLECREDYVIVALWIKGEATTWTSGTKTSPYDCCNLNEDLTLYGSGKTSPCDTTEATCRIRSLCESSSSGASSSASSLEGEKMLLGTMADDSLQQVWSEFDGHWVPQNILPPDYTAEPPPFDPLPGETISTPAILKSAVAT